MQGSARDWGVATVHIDTQSGEIARVERPGVSDAASFPFGEARSWDLVLSLDGQPCRRLVLPDPGPESGEGAFTDVLLAACRAERARELAARSLRRRMGAEESVYEHPEVSVIVCTRGRKHSLARLLEAAAELDPTPAEVVVVDNAPLKGEDCRDLVEGAGMTYVQEKVPGLNVARRTGVAKARGALLAFTDDDCLPTPRWLAPLAEIFADPSVGAATGPAFPVSLDTPAQIRFERAASFSRGLQPREWDFISVSPALASRVGAGANMVLRRDALAGLGEIFPPELDAGTPTRSGGDAYALYKLLAGGRRVVYHPRFYTYHRHRSDARALHDVVRGYGVGLGALATRLIVKDREPEGLLIYRWLISQYLRTVGAGFRGASDPVDVRLAWDYLRGGVAGPTSWARSRRRSAGALASADLDPAPHSEAEAAAIRPLSSHKDEPPEISIVVITHRQGEIAGRCLAALAAQVDAPPFETILVDDSRDSVLETPIPPGLRIRKIRSGGRGAAAARNAGAAVAKGKVLLFLDDDLIPGPELVARHAQRQRDESKDSLVIGYSAPVPRRRTFAAQAAALWWEAHYMARTEAVAPMFTDVLSGNVSMPIAAFRRVGPFDPAFGRLRREDWEWGMRALQAGLGLVYEPEAVAIHRFALDTRGRLDAAYAEGAGDALLAAQHPLALPSLPASKPATFRRASGHIAFRLLMRDGLRRRAVSVLDGMERLKLRGAWARSFGVAQRAAYKSGFHGAGGRTDARTYDELAVELCSEAPLPTPRVAAPLLKLTLGGKPLGTITPVDGQWTAAVAAQAAHRMPRALLGRPSCIDPASLPPRQILSAAVIHARAMGASPIGRWQEIVRRIAACDAELLVVALSSPHLDEESVQPALAALAGARLALATGGGIEPARAPGPTLLSRATTREPYPMIGPPSRYVALRRRAYDALGGFDVGAAALGDHGPILDLLERALNSDWVVAHCDLGSLPAEPPSRRQLAQLERWRARGALMNHDAGKSGRRWWIREGLLPVIGALPKATRRGGPRLRNALGAAVAFAAGSAGLGPGARQFMRGSHRPRASL